MMNPVNVTERVVIAESPFAPDGGSKGFHGHAMSPEMIAEAAWGCRRVAQLLRVPP